MFLDMRCNLTIFLQKILAKFKLSLTWAVVVADLVERSLPTQKIRRSNPDIDKILSTICTIEITKIKNMRLGMTHL